MYRSSNPDPTLTGNTPQVGVYECEVKLKFRLLEEELANCDREELLQLLLDAFAYGSDGYLEAMQAEATVQEISALDASPEMRRQLIRLQNGSGLIR